jgi:hypothetical protein
MYVLAWVARVDAAELGVQQQAWGWWTGSYLRGRTKTTSRLASGRSEGVQTGKGQGTVACHLGFVGHLVVVAANLAVAQGAVAGHAAELTV